MFALVKHKFLFSGENDLFLMKHCRQSIGCPAYRLIYIFQFSFRCFLYLCYQTYTKAVYYDDKNNLKIE